MKVLIISSDSTFFKKDAGGDVWQRHLAYAQNLEKLFIVVKAASSANYATIVKDNVTVIPSGGKNRFSIIKNLYRKSAQIIRQQEVDLVNTQDPMIYGLIGYLLSRKFKIPLVMNWHGDFLENHAWLKEKPINRILVYLAKFLAKRADALRAVSPKIKSKLLKLGLAEQKIKVIPTPVDLEKFLTYDPVLWSNLSQKYQDKKVVLFVGRLEAVKNLALALRVFKRVVKQIPSARLLIIGEGGLRSQLDEIIKEERLAGEVELLGLIDHDQLSSYYRLAKVLILPSAHESFGKVILEAAMQQTPTLASQTTGASSIIEEEELLFPVNNEEEFLRKLSRLLTEETLRQHLGQKLYYEVKDRYSWAESVRAVNQMWQELSKNN